MGPTVSCAWHKMAAKDEAHESSNIAVTQHDGCQLAGPCLTVCASCFCASVSVYISAVLLDLVRGYLRIAFIQGSYSHAQFCAASPAELVPVMRKRVLLLPLIRDVHHKFFGIVLPQFSNAQFYHLLYQRVDCSH